MEVANILAFYNTATVMAIDIEREK